MSKIYNSDVTKGLAKNAGIQINVDKVPNELAEKIVPTFETNPEQLRRINYIASTTKTTTGDLDMATNSARDFYACAISVSYVKDAACDSATGFYNLQITPAETNTPNIVYRFPIITKTAEKDSQIIYFNPPIKLKAGSGLTFAGTFTAGNCSRCAALIGYYTDSKAV